ncbi:hypothetical protein [Clostridium peptidivorans]|uniref:hypothetical protein n=1 Tax=Clostridium peptidivorans TaxID=100174 RepID=UPI000BE2D828|nr:hypothetical protein [Clostridium peptidivorans]
MARSYDYDHEYKSSRLGKCIRCGNLLENGSFETDLTGWVANNVATSGELPFEGVATARMGQTTPSMFQDVLLDKTCRKPLLLSFEIYLAIFIGTIEVGNLIVEVLWLDGEENIIGTGLRTLIPEERTSDIFFNRLTFVEITDTPPENAVKARLQFTKGARANNTTNIIDIDNIILAPIDSINLVKNSGFQLGLENWNFANAAVRFTNIYEGTARINLGPNGTLSQNVPINRLPYNSNFLLSFAADVPDEDDFKGGTFLRVQVIWLNRFGNPIGTGLDLSIDGDMIDTAFNYTTYVDVTSFAPDNAVAAQIKFINTDRNLNFDLDKIIFARVKSGNLLQNPSFENASSINPWIAEGTTVTQATNAYEGRRFARISNLGGSIYQIVSIEKSYCYLLNFGYQITDNTTANLLAEVYWLDKDGQEIGLGLSIIILNNSILNPIGIWLTFLGVTEPAPENAVRARIQFSKSIGNTTVDIDKVVFARLV